MNLTGIKLLRCTTGRNESDDSDNDEFDGYVDLRESLFSPDQEYGNHETKKRVTSFPLLTVPSRHPRSGDESAYALETNTVRKNGAR